MNSPQFPDSPLHRFPGSYGPLDRVVFAYLGIVSGIALAGAPWPAAGVFTGFHALAAVLVILVVRAEGRFGGAFWRAVRWWYPMVLIPSAFREMHWLVPALGRPVDRFDATLDALDLRLFGAGSGWLIERIGHPLLTDVLFVCYAAYYFLPILLGLRLYAREKLAEFETGMTAITATFLVSYLGYIVVPAVGPYYFLTAAERHPALAGVWVTTPIRDALKSMEWLMPDAFPSGHTMVTLVTLHYAWRHARRLAYALIPVGGGLIVATVYLRYHYWMDVAAGVVLTAGVLAAMRWVNPAGSDAKALRREDAK